MGRGIVGRTCPANAIRRFLRCVACLSLVLTIGWASALPAQASQPAPDRALMLLAPGADANSVVEAIRRAGGKVTHVFPPAALIGQLPLDAQVPAGVDAIYRQAVDEFEPIRFDWRNSPCRPGVERSPVSPTRSRRAAKPGGPAR